MKNIFLSASIPIPDRDKKYYDTADIIAIRDAVIALTTILLPHHRLIWGGHPSITPLIYYVIERTIINKLERTDWDIRLSEEECEIVKSELKSKVQNHVTLYQSLYFKEIFPEDNNKFENIVFTPSTGDKLDSIRLMRQNMLSENQFSAAVFIGGMDGIEAEFNMFREQQPDALLLPIASTGAATRIVYNNLLQEKYQDERLVKDYGYMSLFQKLLIEKI
ncbi:hypothetical protein ACFS6H_00220 [Terrimonas rubra]|uniref:Uncharacterized protein n=1 Tax=Terrimonas rubra TaxID=1035890 RepID=A0ABW6A1Z9_9BACT